MEYSMREGLICVERGRTRHEALDDALKWMNGFLISSMAELESVSVQYEKLAETDEYECTLTFIYKNTKYCE
ncbi:MAG: hypothetical protein LUG99_17420 [Lachnospiraceae bacterium]|nr:hypothetical protein [Lachnospiraceae bacterium]